MAESEIPEDIRRAALGVFWRLADRHEATQKTGDAFWSDEATPLIIAEALLAERVRAQKDAERYRWLRAGNAYVPEEQMCTGGEYLDEICDEGIAAIRHDNPNETGQGNG